MTRDELIAFGLIKPKAGNELLTRVRLPKDCAVLRLDRAGRKAAERTIARPVRGATGRDDTITEELSRRARREWKGRDHG